ncbi:hypothetical protein Glove_481g13 [Diversispora epigaea]|uniref:Cryptic loci regulator 2 N-terminal domain-containing protein n=1 Tax=Diversispora epigaea TaxID=1348612 RepID=A0A397GP22_9GLOM|nr:hypothetical protein Glove_481g13 [Diversispora epigaea]
MNTFNAKITSRGIKITYSDGIFNNNYPKISGPVTDKSGNTAYIGRVKNNDNVVKTWLKKLGEGLARYLNSNYNLNIDIVGAILKDFPEGYLLFTHDKIYKNSTRTRSDKFLHGPHKYRSPRDFLPHLCWLVSDKTTKCECRHCMADKKLKKSLQIQCSPEEVERTECDECNESCSYENRFEKFDLPNKEQDKITTLFRCGEIVWVDFYKLDNPRFNKLIKDVYKKYKISIKYWPGVILNRDKALIFDLKVQKEQSQPYDLLRMINFGMMENGLNESSETNRLNESSGLNESSESIGSNELSGSSESSESSESTPETPKDPSRLSKVIYTVEILGLTETLETDRKVLAPWLAYQPNIKLMSKKRGRDEKEEHEYIQAIRQAKIISQSYTALNKMMPESSKTRRMTRNLRNRQLDQCEALFLGAELLCKNDIVRLTPIDNEHPTYPEYPDPQYLFISDIKKTATNGIQLVGHGLLRGKLINKSGIRTVKDYEWYQINTTDEEYTIDLSDVAGRFYVAYPDISEAMDSSLNISYKDRWGIMEIFNDGKKRLSISPAI